MRPIRQVLTRMSIPSGIGIISILAFNLIDTFFVSMLGTDALTALSFTFPVTFVISSLIIGVGAGLSANLGRMLGQGNHQNAARFLQDGVLLTLAIIISLSLLGLVTITPLFTLLGAEATFIPLISDYMVLWYLAIPLLVMPMLGNNALRAGGNTQRPSQIMILSGLLNALLDPLLIFGYGPVPALGIQGAALATALSWLAALLFSLVVLYRHQWLTRLALNWQTMRRHWQQLMHIGRPAALSNMLNPLANGILMALLARYDTDAVAAFGVGIRVESLLLVAVMALGTALIPFIAQNLGAGQSHRAYRALLGSTHFVLAWQLLLYLVVALFAPQIAALFTDDPQVTLYLVLFLRLVPFAYGALAVVILLAMSLNAYNRPGASLLLNLSRLFLLMLPLAWLGGTLVGAAGVLAAIAVANILMGGASYLLVLRISEK